MKQLFVVPFLVATVTSLVSSQEPIRERIEWADIWVTDADKSDLPRVLLIGDSITRGYFDGVEKQLAGKAYCARLTTSKCVADPSFLDEVQLMLKQYRFTVIHFNNGLHGFGYTEEQYRAGLAALLEVLAKHSQNAKLIWATSTPMRTPNNLGQIAETTERVKARNRIAAELLRDRSIVTDDLYGLVEQHQDYFSGDGVHFNEKGRELQAKQVAEAVVACLSAGCVNADDRIFAEKQSNKAEETAKSMRIKIQDEITTLGNHAWAGEYYHGDGMGVNVTLFLAPKSGYVFEWHGCLGLYDRNYGTVTENNGRLHLSFTFANKQEGFLGIAEEFIPIAWGDRKYLIPSDDVLGFCNEVNDGSEPRKSVHGMYGPFQ